MLPAWSWITPTWPSRGAVPGKPGDAELRQSVRALARRNAAWTTTSCPVRQDRRLSEDWHCRSHPVRARPANEWPSALPGAHRARYWRVLFSAAESCFAGPHDRLGAVGDLEFGEDVGDVVTHRLRAEHEDFRQVGVVAPGRDEVEHLVFARGELREHDLGNPRSLGG